MKRAFHGTKPLDYEAQRRAYVIADNQTTLESKWDGAILKLELEWIKGSGADMALTGFDGKALALAMGVGRTDTPLTPPPAPLRAASYSAASAGPPA